jgi:16S rRNA G527 N7-methylase RsmG
VTPFPVPARVQVVDMMMAKQNLNKDSLFIDIGSGLGKPNIHVAQVHPPSNHSQPTQPHNST